MLFTALGLRILQRGAPTGVAWPCAGERPSRQPRFVNVKAGEEITIKDKPKSRQLVLRNLDFTYRFRSRLADSRSRWPER